MEASSLGNDFQNYFNVFKPREFKPDNPAVTSEKRSAEEIRQMVESSKGMNSGVVVTITPPEKLAAAVEPKTYSDLQTVIPEAGKIVRKDLNSSVPADDFLAQRITLASVKGGSEVLGDEVMKSLLDKAASQKIDLSGIARLTGAGNNDSLSTVFESRVELGGFHGVSPILSMQGDVVGYFNRRAAPMRVGSETNISLGMATESGNKLSITVSVYDRYNQNNLADKSTHHVGMARDIQFSITSDSPLSDKEKEVMYKALEALTPLTNAFQENLSVTQGELSALTDITDSSDSGVKALSLRMSTFEGRHQISLDKVSGEQESIATKAYADDFYRLQAQGTSSAQYYLRQYDSLYSEKQWENMMYAPAPEWQRDIISVAHQDFGYGVRSWLASNLE